MKTQFKAATLALAVASAFALSTTAAWAWGDDYGSGANLKTSISIDKDIDVDGHLNLKGNIKSKSDSEAVVNDSQSTGGNFVDNDNHKNNASASGDALHGAQGNIGLNVGAGDNNIQSNEAALAATDASTVFGAASAQVFQDQTAHWNHTYNNPAANNASMSGNVLQNAQGNIGANVAAGDSNVQKNVLSASAADSNFAIASIDNSQATYGNSTHNTGTTKTTTVYDPVSLTLSGHLNHPSESGENSNEQSIVDELNETQLTGTVSGCIPVTTTSIVWSQDNASISGNALRGAMGNIGANVAAGTNNLQSNILSVAAALGTKGASAGGE
ncbi:MAG: hypothetical protein ACRETC_11410 [Gammaproteobacteria bacterium]